MRLHLCAWLFTLLLNLKGPTSFIIWYIYTLVFIEAWTGDHQILEQCASVLPCLVQQSIFFPINISKCQSKRGMCQNISISNFLFKSNWICSKKNFTIFCSSFAEDFQWFTPGMAKPLPGGGIYVTERSHSRKWDVRLHEDWKIRSCSVLTLLLSITFLCTR